MTDYKKVIVKLFICLLLAVLLFPLIFVGVKQDSAQAYIYPSTDTLFTGTQTTADDLAVPVCGVYFAFKCTDYSLLPVLFFIFDKPDDSSYCTITFSPFKYQGIYYYQCNIILNNSSVYLMDFPVGTYITLSLYDTYSNASFSGGYTFAYRADGYFVSRYQAFGSLSVSALSVVMRGYSGGSYTTEKSYFSSLPYDNLNITAMRAYVPLQHIFNNQVITEAQGYAAGFTAGNTEGFNSWDNLMPSIVGSFASFFLILLGGIEIFGTSLLVLLGSIGALAVVFIVVSKLRG